MQGLVLTASPEFIAPAMEEIRDLAPSPPQLKLLGEGVFFWPTDQVPEMIQLIRQRPPLFLHHLHAVVATWDYQGQESTAQQVLQLLQSHLDAPAGSRIAVQGRAVNTELDWQPRQLKQAVDLYLGEHGWQPTIKQPDWVVSVTLAEETVYAGLGPVSENLSSWSGGMVHFRKEPGDISRSKFKLLEAIERWQLELPREGRALDLGAAPGGWTSVLLEHGLWVTAVDTGELDARLLDHPRLTFRRQNVTELRLPAGSSWQLITCDMSWDPFFTVRTINGLVSQLVVGGQALLTVKLMGKRPRQTVRQVMERLDPRLAVLHAQHLFHNRQEVTLHLSRMS